MFWNKKARDNDVPLLSSEQMPLPVAEESNLVQVYPKSGTNLWSYEATVNGYLCMGDNGYATSHHALAAAIQTLKEFQLHSETGEVIVPTIVFYQSEDEYSASPETPRN